jgi:hypothetical protein
MYFGYSWAWLLGWLDGDRKRRSCVKGLGVEWPDGDNVDSSDS